MKNSESYELQFYCPVELSICNKTNMENKYYFSIKTIQNFEKLMIITALFKQSEYKDHFIHRLRSSFSYFPPWVCFPDRDSISIFFRQGIGEEYTEHWLKIAKDRGNKYTEHITYLFPPNADWREFLEIRLY